ncbi:ubiquitin-like small modifier protein 1 [Chloroflexota bacterium]
MPVVKLFGNLRDYAETSKVDVSGGTVREVLDGLCTQSPALCEVILEGGELNSHLQVMLNGRGVDFIQGLDSTVTANDQIAIFPPIAGG